MLDPENRLSDGEFLERFCRDAEALSALGWNRSQIVKSLTLQPYVRTWATTPPWLEVAKSLPRGVKWTDGCKYENKATKRSPSETCVLLPHEGDMYFKGLLAKCWWAYVRKSDGKALTREEARELPRDEVAVTHPKAKTICVIRDFRRLGAIEVVDGLKDVMTPFFAGAIRTTWKRFGGSQWPPQGGTMLADPPWMA